jgi:hypothetical protein
VSEKVEKMRERTDGKMWMERQEEGENIADEEK